MQTERLKEEQNGKRKRGYEEYMAERWMQDMRRPYEDRTRLEIAELTAELDGLEQQRLARENPQVSPPPSKILSFPSPPATMPDAAVIQCMLPSDSGTVSV